MRSLLLVVAAVLALSSGGARTGVALSDVQTDVLSTIDQPATIAQLDGAFGSGSAATGIATIASDAGSDVGVRLRAIHALVSYPGAASHQALLSLVSPRPLTSSGSAMLTLRAAIESLGELHDASSSDLDEAAIVPYLDDNSRDIRAAAALAMRDLGNAKAICPLRTRLQHESTAQVRLAISEALRVLGPSSCP